MEFIEQRSDGALVLLSKDEVGIIGNALNEVCNGIHIRGFETRMSCTLVEVKGLLKKMGQTYKMLSDS